MNTSKWTIAILLATCISLPAMGSQILKKPNPKEKRTIITRLVDKIQKLPLEGRTHPTFPQPIIRKTVKSKDLERLIAQKKAQTTACTCEQHDVTEEEWEAAEMKLQELRDAWTPESLEPFPTLENHPELLPNRCTCQKPATENASGTETENQTATSTTKQQPADFCKKHCRLLRDDEMYEAEQQLQHLRETTDPAASFEKYPELMYEHSTNCLYHNK